MKITFDEQAQIQELLNTRDAYNIRFANLRLMAQYYMRDGNNIRSDLKDYIKNNCLEYNEPLYDKNIEECIKYAQKNELIKSEPIPYTEKEHSAIMSISNYEIRRVMFVLFMYVKHRQYNSHQVTDLYYEGIDQIFQLAKVSYSKKKWIEYRKILADMKLVDYVFQRTQVNCIDKDDCQEIKEKLKPTNCIVEYIIGFEEKYKSKKCVVCDEWFSILNSNHKSVRCSKCQAANNAKINREKVTKFRSNSM